MTVVATRIAAADPSAVPRSVVATAVAALQMKRHLVADPVLERLHGGQLVEPARCQPVQPRVQPRPVGVLGDDGVEECAQGRVERGSVGAQ